jgi:hypothetical protein
VRRERGHGEGLVGVRCGGTVRSNAGSGRVRVAEQDGPEGGAGLHVFFEHELPGFAVV